MTASPAGSTPAQPAVNNVLHLSVNYNKLEREILYGCEIHENITYFDSFEDVLYP